MKKTATFILLLFTIHFCNASYLEFNKWTDFDYNGNWLINDIYDYGDSLKYPSCKIERKIVNKTKS
jgi:hypothetical protein